MVSPPRPATTNGRTVLPESRSIRCVRHANTGAKYAARWWLGSPLVDAGATASSPSRPSSSSFSSASGGATYGK